MAEEKFVAENGIATEGDLEVAGNVDGVKVSTFKQDYDDHEVDTNPHNVTANTVGLGNVENTALSTWPGSSNITQLGVIADLQVTSLPGLPDKMHQQAFVVNVQANNVNYIQSGGDIVFGTDEQLTIDVMVLNHGNQAGMHGALHRRYTLELYQNNINSPISRTVDFTGILGFMIRLGEPSINGSGKLEIPLYGTSSLNNDLIVMLTVYGRQSGLDLFANSIVTAPAAGTTTIQPQAPSYWYRLGVNMEEPVYTLDIGGDINTSTGFRINGVYLNYGHVGAAPFVHDHAGQYEEALGTIAPPTSLTLSDQGNYIEVGFNESVTPDITAYEIWRSEISSSSGFSLIGIIREAYVTAAMTFNDDFFTRKGTNYYEIHAVKHGVRSVVLAGSIASTGDVAEVTNLQIQANRSMYYMTYDIPSDTRLDHIEIRVDAQLASGNLAEGNSTLVYSGLANNFTYLVPHADRGKYHQFWISTITRI